MKRVASFAASGAAVAASGFAILDDAGREARLAICTRCPRARREGSRLSCTACGCDLGVKARFRASTCPLGKW